MHEATRRLSIIAALAMAACTAAPPMTPPAAAPVEDVKPATQVAAVTESQSSEKKDEIVCYKERATGTRFAKQVCRKRSDMDQQSRDSQQAMKDLDRRGNNGRDPLMGN